MGTKDRYSQAQVQRILGITEKQLDYWERLRLVSAQKEKGSRFYDFGDLVSLRTVKQLVEKGVPANRLQRALAALHQGISRARSPLSELRVASDGKDLFVERNGARLEPVSGQFLLNFDTRELDETVSVMAGRGADEWLAIALRCEAEGKARAEAIDAYNRALSADSQKLEALLNCGTLYYEDGNLETASQYFRRVLALDADNALAHFNLGSVLEESGKLDAARQHLRQAVCLRPDYSDAHYNLALVCEKMSSHAEAQQHWEAYVKLDPASPWCAYARERIASFKKAMSAAGA